MDVPRPDVCEPGRARCRLLDDGGAPAGPGQPRGRPGFCTPSSFWANMRFLSALTGYTAAWTGSRRTLGRTWRSASGTDERQESRLIGDYKTHESDTGSPEVQVAILSERINYLTEHFKTAREGSPLAPRPAEAGRPAPTPARLPEEQGRRALRRAHQAPRHPEVEVSRRSTSRSRRAKRDQPRFRPDATRDSH